MARLIVLAQLLALLLIHPTSAGAAGLRELAVPYRTQLDGNPYQHADCGPASLGMALAAYGLIVPTRALRAGVNDLQGTWGDYDAGADIAVLAALAGRYGVRAEGLGDTHAPHRWTVDELRERLDAGEPVVAELRYRALPGHEGSAFEGDHYVVLTGYDADDFLYDDPIDPVGQGAVVRIGAARLERAWRGDRSYAAFAVVGPDGGLPAQPAAPMPTPAQD